MNLTATVCLSLLLSGGPDRAGQPNSSEMSAAKDWLEAQGMAEAGDEQQRNIFQQWYLWKSATAQAREAHLGLELKSISPAEKSTVHAFQQRQRLEQLSRQNLVRLKNEIAETHKIETEIDPALMEQVREMSGNLAFHYLRPYRPKRETGIHPPLASYHELARLNLNVNPTYYSSLVGDSPSVGFGVVATKASVGPLSLNAQVPYSALRLNGEFAEANGFVLPQFKNTLELFSFFQRWEPGVMEQVLRQNRMSLPNSVDSVEKLMLYLHPGRLEQVFPSHSLYHRLAVLRQRLHRYILTESDARELMHWAFERFLISTALEDPQHFVHLQNEFKLAAGPQNIYAKEFLPYLGLNDLALRIPLSVPSAAYSVLRIENVAYNPYPDYTHVPQHKWDSRRLDHNLKP